MSVDHEALEAACRYALSQQADNICWMDLYTHIAKILGVEWKPTLIPKECLRANCDRFIDSIYSGLPYDPGDVSRVIQEHHDAKQLLRDAGYGVTGTPLIATVREALADLEKLRGQ